MLELTKSFEYASRGEACRGVVEDDRPPAVRAHEVVIDLFKALPELRALLAQDARAALAGDPAAGSLAEVLLSYPGMRAIAIHRIANHLYKQHVPAHPPHDAGAHPRANGDRYPPWSLHRQVIFH